MISLSIRSLRSTLSLTSMAVVLPFALAFGFSARPSVVLLPVFLVLSVLWLQYLGQILRSRALHSEQLPVLSLDAFFSTEGVRLVGLLGMLMLLLSSVGLAAGKTAAALVGLIVWLLLPACMAIVVVTQSVWSGLNPRSLLRLIATLGKGYAIPVVASGLAALSAWSTPDAPLSAWLSWSLALYFSIVSSYAMGVQLAEHHEICSYPVITTVTANGRANVIRCSSVASGL